MPPSAAARPLSTAVLILAAAPPAATLHALSHAPHRFTEHLVSVHSARWRPRDSLSLRSAPSMQCGAVVAFAPPRGNRCSARCAALPCWDAVLSARGHTRRRAAPVCAASPRDVPPLRRVAKPPAEREAPPARRPDVRRARDNFVSGALPAPRGCGVAADPGRGADELRACDQADAVLDVVSRNAELLTGPNLGIAFQRLAKFGARLSPAAQSALVADPRTKQLGCACLRRARRAPATLTRAARTAAAKRCWSASASRAPAGWRRCYGRMPSCVTARRACCAPRGRTCWLGRRR